VTKPSSQIRGLVVGTRKCGTTWLYENFRVDPQFRVSEKVKESGYFAGAPISDANTYEALLDGATGVHPVEVDTSVCYAPDAANRIMAYNSNMRIVLILRDPAAYLASRYTHSLRKGELNQTTPLQALKQVPWLRAELDYPALIDRFEEFNRAGQLTVLPFAALKKDPVAFYHTVATALGGDGQSGFCPSLMPVNVARNARFAWLSHLLSNGAKMSRAMGAHRLVNMIKGTGVLSMLERPAEASSFDMEILAAEIERVNPGTQKAYNAVCAKVGVTGI
jgi:hypothetical protein